MKSMVAVTSEFDDIELAVKSLIYQIRKNFELDGNSVGIVYCAADVDVAALGEGLHTGLGIDIIGITTTATVERNSGYSDMGILLCVLTADDVNFTIGCTEELNGGTFPDSIRKAYEQARSEIQADPRLILTLAPYLTDITSENYAELLHEASGGVPVFGGVATDGYRLKFQRTFFNGQASERRLVFLLFSGKVKPMFAMEHHFGAKVEKKAIITKSEGNLVQKLGDQTFKDFVASMIPVPEEEMVIFYFQSTPFVMELPDFEKDEQPVVRLLCTIDHATGAGGFLSKMPEGSAIYLNVLQKDNLSESCANALTNIIRQMNENTDYKYSMIFISTCDARHLLIGHDKELESGIISEKLKNLPPELNAMGFYAFGEMCPTGTRADGTAKNRFHNISFAVCAV